MKSPVSARPMWFRSVFATKSPYIAGMLYVIRTIYSINSECQIPCVRKRAGVLEEVIEKQTVMISAPHHIRIGHFTVGNDQPLTLIAGPCAIESRSHALEMGHGLTEMARKLGIGLIYKSSFDKANRTSIRSNRGVG